MVITEWMGTNKQKTYDGTLTVIQRYTRNVMNLDDLINFLEKSLTFDTLKKSMSVEQRMYWVKLLIQNEMKSVITDLILQIDTFSFKCVECGKLYSGIHEHNGKENSSVTVLTDYPEDGCMCVVERMEDIYRYIINEYKDLWIWVEMAKV